MQGRLANLPGSALVGLSPDTIAKLTGPVQPVQQQQNQLFKLPEKEETHTVYVQGLPGKTENSDIRELLESFGEIASVSLHRRDEKRGVSAHVSFENAQSAQNAVTELNGRPCKDGDGNNFTLQVAHATPKPSGPPPSAIPPEVGDEDTPVEMVTLGGEPWNPDMGVVWEDGRRHCPWTLYVCNLPQSLGQDGIRDLCAQFGEIANCKRLHDEWEQDAIALVRYKSPAEAGLAAGALNGLVLESGSKALHAKAARTGPGKPQPPRTGRSRYLPWEGQDPFKVYVGGWPQALPKEEQLRAVFEVYGAITSAKLLPGTKSRDGSGFGFVKYRHWQSASAAIWYLDQCALHGNLLNVRFARWRGGEADVQTADPSAGMDSQAIRREERLQTLAMSGEAPILLDGEGQELDPCTLFVRRLPRGSTKQSIEAMFSAFGEVTRAHMTDTEHTDGTYDCRAWVRFRYPAEAQLAATGMNGQANAAEGPVDDGKQLWITTARRSPGQPLYERVGVESIDCPAGCEPDNLYVRHLPPKSDPGGPVDGVRLKTIFSTFGEVEQANIRETQKTGGDRHGWVRFRSALDARTAAYFLDGNPMIGSVLSVTFARRRAGRPGLQTFNSLTRGLPWAEPEQRPQEQPEWLVRAAQTNQAKAAEKHQEQMVMHAEHSRLMQQHMMAQQSAGVAGQVAAQLANYQNQLKAQAMQVLAQQQQQQQAAAGAAIQLQLQEQLQQQQLRQQQLQHEHMHQQQEQLVRQQQLQEHLQQQQQLEQLRQQEEARKLASVLNALKAKSAPAPAPPPRQADPISALLDRLGGGGLGGPAAPAANRFQPYPGAADVGAQRPARGVPQTAAEVAYVLDTVPGRELHKDGDPETFLISKAREALSLRLGAAVAAQIPKAAIRDYLSQRTPDGGF
eukprot:Hpha_TRINITY_DN15173_c2_g11::TRINITY_DN15173_c2_g11_i1::g.129165::m.129165/K13126/PABPC; polyadenylate-binding protein